MAIESDKIFSLINPPDNIMSWDHLNEIINDKSCLSVIEKPFYAEAKKIIHKIIEQNIAGDVVVAGVFKGGSALYLKALFEEAGVFKKWWIFDSFKGFNLPTIKHAKDIDTLNKISNLVNLKEQPTVDSVLQLFKNNYLDGNLEIIPGYFEDTFPLININEICLLHIDVDFYEPTLYCLQKFYPTLQYNGYVIIDDYFVESFECKNAVDDYRMNHQITSKVTRLGNYPAGWQKDNMGISPVKR